MKKFLIIAAAAMMAFSACNKNVSTAPNVDPDEIFDGTEKYPIVFGTNMVNVKTPVTKGMGSVEAWDAAQTLYVYGVERVNGILNLTDGILIDNQGVSAPVDTDGIEVYDVAYPGENIPYYYDYTSLYDFFGYYVDDAQIGEIANDGTSVTLPITIDGTQDVMLAKASREGWTAQNSGAPIDPDKLFSAYGVRKGVQPNLVFEHQLTRLVFNVINGNGVEAEAEPTLFLNNLSVTSPVSGTLGIINAAPLLVNVEDVGAMALTSIGGGEFEKMGIVGTQQAGGCIMVMPGQTEYPLSFQLEQTGKALPVDQTETIKLAGNAAFEAGKSYKVNLTIYGLEQIQISVALTAWDTNTEDITLGNDEV